MKIKEVLDVFTDPSESREDTKTLWMVALDQNNRIGYLPLDTDKHPAFSEILNSAMPFRAEETLKRASELLRADNSIDENFSMRPHIEDASPALQLLFDEMESFSDSITYFVEENDQIWEDLGISRQEFEQQIDSDIEKFGLSECVCKLADDEATLYTCYGNLLCSFSKSYSREITATAEKEDSNEMPSLSSDGNDSLMSVSFIPISFQREKDVPFRICKLFNQSDKDNPLVSYVVIRDGRDVVNFTARKGEIDNAFFSALDYVACAYHDNPELAAEHFDGFAYAKEYYDVCFFSNPATRLQHTPLSLDAHWKQSVPDYDTKKVFGDSIINGELSDTIIKEIEHSFNSSLENPNFPIDTALLSQLDSQPPICDVRHLDESIDISETPLYAAAQYEWEHERSKKILEGTEEGITSYLSALNDAMEKNGPTRELLERYGDLLCDLCRDDEEFLYQNGVSFSQMQLDNSSWKYSNMENRFKNYREAFDNYQEKHSKAEKETLPQVAPPIIPQYSVR